MSHNKLTPSTVTTRILRVEELAASCVSAQQRWAAAMAAKSMTELSSAVPAAKAGLVATPATWPPACGDAAEGKNEEELAGDDGGEDEGEEGEGEEGEGVEDEGEEDGGSGVGGPVPFVTAAEWKDGGGLDNVSATTLAVPATCWMSLVYSAM
jgi:hypothetical protein